VQWCQPKCVIGVGKFAEGRALAALGKTDRAIGTILHPSPASPAANRGWQEQAEKQLHQQGIKLPHIKTKGREL
jgi:single-strand selective monofunctional uracil DNA glycosylase